MSVQELQSEISNFGKELKQRIKAAGDKLKAAKVAVDRQKKELKAKETTLQVRRACVLALRSPCCSCRPRAAPTHPWARPYPWSGLRRTCGLAMIVLRLQAAMAELQAAGGERAALQEQLLAAQALVAALAQQVSRPRGASTVSALWPVL